MSKEEIRHKNDEEEKQEKCPITCTNTPKCLSDGDAFPRLRPSSVRFGDDVAMSEEKKHLFSADEWEFVNQWEKTGSDGQGDLRNCR